MTLFGGRLNALLAMALAAVLALAAVSAFADPAPDGPGDVVTVDTGDGDSEGETEGGDSVEVVCGVDGDAEGDTEGDADCDADGDEEGDADSDDVEADQADGGQGPNPDRGCTRVLDTGGLTLADGSTSEDGVAEARNRLLGFLDEGSPADQGLEGIRNALDKMCHGFFASAGSEASGDAADSGGEDGDGGDSDTEDSDGDDSTHPGNGHAFGRDHGQGKPESGPANGGE